jgi:hypothetical protein
MAHAAHAVGIKHRDLKPEHFVARSGQAEASISVRNGAERLMRRMSVITITDTLPLAQFITCRPRKNLRETVDAARTCGARRRSAMATRVRPLFLVRRIFQALVKTLPVRNAMRKYRPNWSGSSRSP